MKFNVKVYGVSDDDKTAENLLEQEIEKQGAQHLSYVVLHPRVPIDASTCRLPGSLLVQAVFIGNVVVSVRQNKIGGEAIRLR